MSLAGLLSAVAEDPQLGSLLTGHPATPGLGGRDLVAPQSMRPVLVAAIAAGATGAATGPGAAGANGAQVSEAGVNEAGTGRFVLAVTATAREAEDLTAALGAFLPPHTVAYFPGWETLPHERLSPRSDTVGQRIAVLRRLAHPAQDDPVEGPLRVVVAPIRGVLQPIVAGLGDLEPVRLPRGGCRSRGRDHAPGGDRLRAGRGGLQARQLAVRGGTARRVPADRRAPAAHRVLWRHGRRDPRSSRSPTSALVLPSTGCGGPPCRELLLTTPVRARAKELADQHPVRRGHARQGRRDSRRGHGSLHLGARRPYGAPPRSRCRLAASCWPATPSASGPGPRNWSPPARNSWRRPGRPPRPAGRRPSTSERLGVPADRPGSAR